MKNQLINWRCLHLVNYKANLIFHKANDTHKNFCFYCPGRIIYHIPSTWHNCSRGKFPNEESCQRTKCEQNTNKKVKINMETIVPMIIVKNSVKFFYFGFLGFFRKKCIIKHYLKQYWQNFTIILDLLILTGIVVWDLYLSVILWITTYNLNLTLM